MINKILNGKKREKKKAVRKQQKFYYTVANRAKNLSNDYLLAATEKRDLKT